MYGGNQSVVVTLDKTKLLLLEKSQSKFEAHSQASLHSMCFNLNLYYQATSLSPPLLVLSRVTSIKRFCGVLKMLYSVYVLVYAMNAGTPTHTIA